MVQVPLRAWWYYYTGGWAMVLLVGWFIVAGFFSGASFISALDKEVAFEREAVKTQGIVNNKSTRRSRPGNKAVYELTYRYRVGENDITRCVVVSKRDWDLAIIGGSIPLEYLKSDPNQSRPAWDGGGFHWSEVALAGCVSVVCLGFAIGLLLFFWRSGRSSVTLLAQGTTARGIVKKIESRREGRVSNTYLVYVFHDEKGQEVIGEEGPLTRRLAKRWQPGDEITIVIDPENPKRRVADLFELRETM
jgi:hypothetical protein